MTNFEKIKNMSVEELADTMGNATEDCVFCPIFKFCYEYRHGSAPNCSGTWEQWLKSEVEE